MSRLTIFQTQSLKEIPKVKKTVKKMKKYYNIKKNKEEIPAVVGEFAGEAINLIMSENFQTALTILGLVELGNKSWELIKNIKISKKHFDFDKNFAYALVLSKALKIYKKVYREEYNTLEPSKIKYIGPMEIYTISKKLTKSCYKNFEDEGLADSGVYFIGIVIKRPNKRSITYWFIIRNDGKICSSWSSQTLTKTLPKHLQ
jgi:hypothetical protein